jgi:hypothetical protein
MVHDYAGAADPRVAPFFNRLGESLRDNLNEHVPGYEALTSEYAKASDLLSELRRELSAGTEYGKAKAPGTIIRKLSYALNQNNDYRKVMLEALDAAAGSNMKQDVAGYSSRSWTPRGLQSVLASSPFALAAAFSHNPASVIPVAALSSPRVAASIIALISSMSRGIPTGVDTGVATGALTNMLAPLAPPPPPGSFLRDGQ